MIEQAVQDMTLDELINCSLNLAAIKEQELEESDRRVRELNQRRRDEALKLTQALLPAALREHTTFFRWHSPNYEFRELWNTELIIAAPGLAPVLMRVNCFDDQETGEIKRVDLRERGDGRIWDTFSVLCYEVSNDDDGYYARQREAEGTDSLMLALASAARIGETYLQAMHEAIQRNTASLEQPEPAAPKLSTCEDHFARLLDCLNNGDKLEGENSTINYMGAIAHALYILTNETVLRGHEQETN